MKRRRSCQTNRTSPSSSPTPAAAFSTPTGDAAPSSSNVQIDHFEYHRNLVSAVLDVGTEYASPSQIFDQMTLVQDPEFHNLKLEQIKSHLQRFRKAFFDHNRQRKRSTNTNNRGGYAKAIKGKSRGSSTIRSADQHEYDYSSNKSNTEKKLFLDEYENFVDFGLDAAAASLASAENNYRSIVGGRIIGLVSRMIMMDEKVFVDGQQHFSSGGTADSTENNKNQENNDRSGGSKPGIADSINTRKIPFQSDTSIPKLTPEEKTSYLGRSIELVIGLLEHLNDHIRRERQRRHNHQNNRSHDNDHMQQNQHRQQDHYLELFEFLPSDAMATAMSIAATSVAGCASMSVGRQPIDGIPLIQMPISTPANKNYSVVPDTNIPMVPHEQQQMTPSVNKMTTMQEKIKIKAAIPGASTIVSNANQHHMLREMPPNLTSEGKSQKRQKHSSTATKDIAFQKLQKVLIDSLGGERCHNSGEAKRAGEELYREWKRDNDDAASSSDLSSLSSSSEGGGEWNLNDVSNTNVPSGDPSWKFRDLTSNLTMQTTVCQQELYNLKMHNLPRDQDVVVAGRKKKTWIFDSFPPPRTINLVCRVNRSVHDRNNTLSCQASTCSCCSSKSSCQWVLTTNINNNINDIASHNERRPQKDSRTYGRDEIFESNISGKVKLQDQEAESLGRGDGDESDISSLGIENVEILRGIQRSTDPGGAAGSSRHKTVEDGNDRQKSSFATLQAEVEGDLKEQIKFSFSDSSAQAYHTCSVGDQVQNKASETGKGLLLRRNPDEQSALSSNHLSQPSTSVSTRLPQQQNDPYQSYPVDQHKQPHQRQLQRNQPHETLISSTSDRLGKFFPIKESDSNDDASI